MRTGTLGFCLWLLHTSAMPAAMAVDVTASETPAQGPVALYDRALAQAGEGQLDEAMATLAAAVEAGYRDVFALRGAPALAPLRERECWAGLMTAFEAHNPWLRILDTDDSQPHYPWLGYAAGWNALQNGSAPIAERVSGPAVAGVFGQFQSQAAAMLGDYDYAHANYFGGLRRGDAAEYGITGVQPALPQLAALVEGRQVVMLNESHGHSNQRAANFLFVRELRKLGFTHLALETLGYDRVEGDGCRSSVLADENLPARGHAVRATGYYTNDPIYAELLRMALAEGYVPVAYDHTLPDPRSPQREQEQARNIACVLERDPDARIVVIGGGSHTSKQPGADGQPGMMGARLKALLSTEPLSIANYTVALQGLPDSPAATGYQNPTRDGPLAGQPYFADTAEGHYTVPGYDRVAFLPVPAARSPEAGWLRLGGWRVPAPAVPLACPKAPCLLEARRVGEGADAIPGDRCVIEAAGGTCTLFLAPGDYEAILLDAAGASSAASHRLAVAAGG
ncbi:MAG: hypothetical protein A2X76_07640 [Lysobacterales bacterium GWF1_69_6]|nr:MAG: hypothetical protein A2X76_07640 [Xanthomonadales bacterium GWF1_69_6]